ncbi:hypothetical protein EYZ11_006225 [Aspergillus tanneri]|uniref:F-box domain-containing protein n=1 Tax=Aspergillus tanneri TaxID=1220188 RepID=A0A4S3JFZ9_9EURO|nr:hypothetical protein EYZ11_006225 [Aspergillus tanneri]
MARSSKKKAPAHRYPDLVKEASEAQILQVLSIPKTWVEADMKCRPLRISPRKRTRLKVTSGFFDFLPFEILDMILLGLDYCSLSTLCVVNTKAESYIKHTLFYKNVVEHCYKALQKMKEWDLLRDAGDWVLCFSYQAATAHVPFALALHLIYH